MMFEEKKCLCDTVSKRESSGYFPILTSINKMEYGIDKNKQIGKKISFFIALGKKKINTCAFLHTCLNNVSARLY